VNKLVDYLLRYGLKTYGCVVELEGEKMRTEKPGQTIHRAIPAKQPGYSTANPQVKTE
jgi:hypothetical protein